MGHEDAIYVWSNKAEVWRELHHPKSMLAKEIIFPLYLEFKYSEKEFKLSVSGWFAKMALQRGN